MNINLPVILLGAGSHAKILIDLMQQQSIQIIGIVDPNMSGYTVLNVPVIGDDQTVFKYKNSAVQLVNGVGSIGDLSKHTQLYEQFTAAGYSFATLIHSSAIIGAEVEIDEGVQIMAGAIVQTGSRIGFNTIINTRAAVDHDCIIGNHVHIAPGVTLSGGIAIDNGTHIGTGATVIQNMHIGKNCIIGAGAVIIKDVPDNAVIVGIPGRVIKFR